MLSGAKPVETRLNISTHVELDVLLVRCGLVKLTSLATLGVLLRLSVQAL